MVKHVFFCLICAGTLVARVAEAQTAPVTTPRKQSDAAAGNVKLRSVLKVYLTKGTPGYAVSYEYDFPQRQSVFIKGFGTVPARGSFRYLTAESKLEFRDSPAGGVLAQVPLQQTVIVAAKPPLLDTPKATDFPADFQMFIWESPKALQERAEVVLNKYVHLAPGSDCEKGMVNLTTTYTPLELKNPPAGVTAQVALLFSFPCDPAPGKYSFQVKSRVMEGRTHSDEFRPTRNPDIVHAADSFVQRLVAEMKVQEDGNP